MRRRFPQKLVRTTGAAHTGLPVRVEPGEEPQFQLRTSLVPLDRSTGEFASAQGQAAGGDSRLFSPSARTVVLGRGFLGWANARKSPPGGGQGAFPGGGQGFVFFLSSLVRVVLVVPSEEQGGSIP